MKNMDNFCYVKEPCKGAITIKSKLFTVSKDEWNTKEDAGMSAKNALYVLWYAKRHLSGQIKWFLTVGCYKYIDRCITIKCSTLIN